MLNKYLNQLVRRALWPTLYDGEAGASGGKGNNTAVLDPPNSFDTPVTESEEAFVQARMNEDPEYQELLKAEKVLADGDKGKGKNAGEDEDEPNPNEDDPSNAEGDLEEEMPAEDDDDSNETEKGGEESKTENGGGENADTDDGEYEDNVIEGLTGQDFGDMTDNGRKAISEFYALYQESVEAKANLQNEHNRVLEDPLVKHRMEVIAAGNQALPYQVAALSSAKVQEIMGATSDTEAANKIVAAANELAQTAFANLQIKQAGERKKKERESAGSSVLFEAGNLHPKHKVKEKDLPKIVKGHSDFAAYAASHAKIIDYAREKGWDLAALSGFQPKELYAAAAAHYGWPVAMNTGDRDKKIVAGAVSSALAPFVKQRGDKRRAQGAPVGSRGTDAKKTKDMAANSGVDIEKLARDDEYHEKVIMMKPGNTEWLDKVAGLRLKGEARLQTKARRK